MFKTALSAVINDAIFPFVVAGGCTVPARAPQLNSGLLLEAFVEFAETNQASKRTTTQKHLTHLEVSDISRGQSRDAEKHCCSLRCFTAETGGGSSSTRTQGFLPGSGSSSPSASSVSLTRLRSPPAEAAAAFRCVSPLCPPLLKCRVDQLPQVVFKPLAALHKTLPWTVFVCVFV